MLPIRAPLATRRSPLVGRWMPAMTLRSVLLPDPLRPMRPTDSPWRIFSDTDLSAQNSSTRCRRDRSKQAEQPTFSSAARVVPEEEPFGQVPRFEDEGQVRSAPRSCLRCGRAASRPSRARRRHNRQRGQPDGAVRPLPVIEDVVVRADVRRQRTEEDQAPQARRRPAQLVDDGSRPEQHRQSHVHEVTHVAKERRARRQDERHADREERLQADEDREEQHRRRPAAPDSRPASTAETPAPSGCTARG